MSHGTWVPLFMSFNKILNSAEILRAALLRAPQVNRPTTPHWLVQLLIHVRNTIDWRIITMTHQNSSSSGTASEQVWASKEQSSWQWLTLTWLIPWWIIGAWVLAVPFLADPVDKGALPRVPVVVALWELVALVGTWMGIWAPWYGPATWGIADAVPVRAATQMVRRGFSCMVNNGDQRIKL